MAYIYYLISVNLLAIFLYGLDKRRAIKNKWRIKEMYLFLIALLGGGIGSLTAMYLFHHKTKKLTFVFGIPSLIILNLTSIYLMRSLGLFDG